VYVWEAWSLHAFPAGMGEDNAISGSLCNGYATGVPSLLPFNRWHLACLSDAVRYGHYSPLLPLVDAS
jgi:hypothetical protein